MINFRRIRTKDQDLSQVQDNVAAVFSNLSLVTLLDGALLVNLSVVNGSNVINHTLGRQPLGWFITDRNGGAVIYRTAWNERTLTLASNASATISLWVF